MKLEIPFWNKVNVDRLTIEILEKENWFFLKVYTNDVNIYNEKMAIEEEENEIKETMLTIIELAEEVGKAHILEDWDLFKELSQELMNYLKSI